jgi:hypothetical protein
MLDWSLVDRTKTTPVQMFIGMTKEGRGKAWKIIAKSLLFNFISIIVWLLDLIFVKIYLSRMYKSTERTITIRIQRIVLRHKINELALSSDHNFICLHQKCVQSFDELMSPNWMIYSFSETHVHFVELTNTFDKYQARQTPFCYLRQFDDAVRMASMTIEDFLKVVPQVSAPTLFNADLLS